MRFTSIRFVRTVTIAVPSLWFFYVLYSVFLLNDGESVPSRDMYVEALGNVKSDGEAPAGVKPEDGEVQEGLGERKMGLLAALQPNNIGDQEKEEGKRNDDVMEDENLAELQENDDAIADINANEQGVQGQDEEEEEEEEEEEQEEEEEEGEEEEEEQGEKEEEDDHDGHAKADPVKAKDDGARDDVDLYADVTYPPFVERLPAGAKGKISLSPPPPPPSSQSLKSFS